MPTPSPRLLLAALHLGARPGDVLTPRRLLGFLVERADLVDDEYFPALLEAVSDARGQLAVSLVDEHPLAFGGLLDRAVEESGLRRPNALARLVAGLPVGYLVVPPVLRPRLHVTLVVARDHVVVSEDDVRWSLVPMCDVEEARAFYGAPEVLPRVAAEAVLSAVR